ncbi:MAG: hypothetical protein AAF658_02820 [Myxococcota bacterium]
MRKSQFRELTSVDLNAFRRFRRTTDPLEQLDRFIRFDGEALQVRIDGPWQTLRGTGAGSGSPAAPPDPSPIHEVRDLRGLRIVLDPGHRGGAWSHEEDRHIAVGPGPAVREGDIAYAVAVQLQRMLEVRGAKVRMTRGPAPARPFPSGQLAGYDPLVEAAQWSTELAHVAALEPVARWRHTSIGRWAAPFFVRALTTVSPFKLYNRYELRRRAEIAAQFDPHVTLSLHFNVARDPLTNGIIVFVLGNFLHNELATASQRYYALRALTSGALEPARRLGVTLGRAMQQELDLPALSEPSDSPVGLAKKIPLAPEDGVFARNLAMLRRTPGVVLLLEGPCMNAVGEFERLQRGDVQVEGLGVVSERTTQYARAVVRGLAAHRDALIRWKKAEARRTRSVAK